MLDVKDLVVTFPTLEGRVQAVRGVNLTLEPGHIRGVVGESGSGKTVTMLAALGLLPSSAEVTGSVKYKGRELLGLPPEHVVMVLAEHSGKRIAASLLIRGPAGVVRPTNRRAKDRSGASACRTSPSSI